MFKSFPKPVKVKKTKKPIKKLGKWALLDKKYLKKLPDGKCEMCGEWRKLDNAHVISRSNKSIRYDIQNLLKLCRGCHKKFDSKKKWMYENWFRAVYPERAIYLDERKNSMPSL